MNRSHVLWIPQNGNGKVRRCLLGPAYLRVFITILVLSLVSIPLLETGMFSLMGKIAQLEATRDMLQEEVARLAYVKRELARIAENEQQLKEYFGMARFRSLKQVVGGSRPSAHLTEGLPSNEEPEVSPGDLPGRLETLAENLEAFGHMMHQQASAWEETPSIMPVALKEPVISSGFGWRKNPFTNKREFHAGIDIIGRTGTGLVAPAAGLVINRGYDRWLGNYLVLQHGADVKTIYGHLHEVAVDQGMRVQRGDRIGSIGNTGLSTSSHLHYSVLEGGRAVNPMQYILDYPG